MNGDYNDHDGDDDDDEDDDNGDDGEYLKCPCDVGQGQLLVFSQRVEDFCIFRSKILFEHPGGKGTLVKESLYI